MLPRRARLHLRLSTLPLHPIGVAAVPVLFLFAENQVQQVTLDPMWRPLGVALAVATATLLTGAALLWDWWRGALLASLALALFFSFGHAWNLVGEQLGDRMWLVDIYLVIGLAGAFLVWRGGRWVRPATSFLNLAVLLLVLFNAGRVVESALGSASPIGSANASTPVGLDVSHGRPDIYYIILDRYAGPETLERVYGVDNEPFISQLEARGFGVARDAWANYFKTALSLTSSLSMDYLDTARFSATGETAFDEIHRALRDHLAVPVTLKSLGYEYVHIANYWPPTATNVDADIVLRHQDATEFDAAVRSTTALMLLDPPSADDNDPESADFPTLARETTLFAFNALEDASRRPGPTFVLAHILVPHTPYVFDTDGSMPTARESEERSEEEAYAAQLAWANQRILEMLDRIMGGPASEEPIVILQADEGPFPTRYRVEGGDFPWLEATPEEVAQKFGILNALHLPGMVPEALGFTDTTSPVNNFRIVLDAVFDADLPLLPDRSYLSRDHDHPYEFSEYLRAAAG